MRELGSIFLVVCVEELEIEPIVEKEVMVVATK